MRGANEKIITARSNRNLMVLVTKTNFVTKMFQYFITKFFFENLKTLLRFESQ